jgi:predicted AlkP superfamily phosphohydrolase/phosphomutase
MAKKKGKTIIIGLDGGTFYLIDGLVNKGILPNLKKIMSEGYKNICKSIYPPLSPPAWVSIATSANPAKHGIFDFFYMPFKKQKSYVRKIVNTHEWKVGTIFKILNDKGLSCGIINYPMGYPPLEVKEYFISGLGTPDESCAYVYPEELKKEINKKFPGYTVDAGGGVGNTYSGFLKACVKSEEGRLELSKYLFDKYDVDLFFVIFAFTDRVQHWFWKFLDKNHPQHEEWSEATEAYQGFFIKFDEFLGFILSRMHENDNLIIMSDHGFGPIKKYFYINKFLYDVGLLKFKTGAKIFTQQNTPDGLLTSIDWSKTRAYSLGDYGEIRINLKGREPMGIINPGKEYDQLVAFIKKLLEAIKDPSDKKRIVDRVFFKKEIYSGEHLGEAPDLIFTMRNCEYISYINGRGNEFYKYDRVFLKEPSKKEMEQWTGSHNLDGIFIAYGKNVNKNAKIKEISILDLPPTILYLQGTKIPSYSDGNALKGLFNKIHNK